MKTEGSCGFLEVVQPVQDNQQEPPMGTLSKVTGALQSVLTVQANRLARQCGVVQRERKLSGATLAQALVLGWLHRPEASVEQLAQVAAACGRPVCPQAIDQRFHERTANFFNRLLQAAVAEVVMADPLAIGLLKRFTGVYVEDSTIISLPTCFGHLWPGSGGNQGRTPAAMKLHVQLDLKTGRLIGPKCVAGRESDHHGSLAEVVPRGAIRLADLGFFDLAQLGELDDRGVFWVTRIQPQTALYDVQGNRLDVARLMRGVESFLDRPIQVGVEERLACRLIVAAVPPAVVRRRRDRLKRDAKRRGRRVSERQRQWCRWTVLVTNVPPERLSVCEALALLKIRWQIELLFKRWKSLGGVDQSRSENPWRILIETYAKLLGMVIQHWLLLVAAWQYEDRSLAKASVAIQDHVLTLIGAIDSHRRLAAAIGRLADILSVAGRLQSRRARPPSYRLLQNPELIDSTLT
jgi:hypothetical protein